MKKKNENKKNFFKVLVLVVALIILGVSVTYAYFTSLITGDAEETSAQAGNLQIETNLETVAEINNTKLRLINSTDIEANAENVSFYVKNTSTSTVNADYFIYLTDITLSKNLYSNYFKWQLLKDDEILASGDFASVDRTDTPQTDEANNVTTTIENIQLNTEAIRLPVNTTQNLSLRMWLENDENVNQINLINGNFSGKLYLEAVPVSVNQ